MTFAVTATWVEDCGRLGTCMHQLPAMLVDCDEDTVYGVALHKYDPNYNMRFHGKVHLSIVPY